MGDLRWHLQRFSQPDPTAWSSSASREHNSAAAPQQDLGQGIKKAGLPATHPHDLRHTGNTLAAMTEASLKELMARTGHSTKAAMIYLHAAKDRNRAIADAIGEIVKQGLKAADDDGGALEPVG